jgi:hypothetical protein
VDPEKPQEPSASCVEAQDDDKLEITAPAEVECVPKDIAFRLIVAFKFIVAWRMLYFASFCFSRTISGCFPLSPNQSAHVEPKVVAWSAS